MMKRSAVLYTVEDAIEQIGFGPFQIVATLLTGMIWLSDALVVMLLAVFTEIVKCQWHLALWEHSLFTFVLFIVFLLSSFSWGVIADSVGRKTSLIAIGMVIFIFDLLSFASPKYSWLLMFRFLVALGIRGSSQVVTYYVEFLSSKFRGVCIVLLALWWAVGSISAAGLALAVIPNFVASSSKEIHWRLLFCVCALSIAGVMTLFVFMPESARYYVSKGEMEKGENVIRYIAHFNRKKCPKGRLVSQEEKNQLTTDTAEKEDKGCNEGNEDETSYQSPDTIMNEAVPKEESSFNEHKPLLEGGETHLPPSPLPPLTPTAKTPSQSTSRHPSGRLKVIMVNFVNNIGRNIKLLFVDKGWRTTVPLLFIWWGCAWIYYGLVVLTTAILKEGYPDCGIGNVTSDVGCDNLMTSTYYIDIVWTSSAEIPGTIMTLVIIQLIGRKVTMAVEFIGAGLSIGLLLICVPEEYLGVLLFCAKGFATGVFQAVYVYTPEVYPTQYRGSAWGLMSSAARIGTLVTPFMAQTVYYMNRVVAILLYVGSCAVLAVLALLLPIETKGRSLN